MGVRRDGDRRNRRANATPRTVARPSRDVIVAFVVYLVKLGESGWGLV